MRPGWHSRHERVSARDAAMRRIAWWTAALAAGSVAGTVGVAGAAQLSAHPTSVEVPVTVAEVSAVAAGDGSEGTDAAPAVADPSGAATTPSRSVATKGSTPKATGSRSTRRSTSAPRRSAVAVAKPRVTVQAPRTQAPRTQAPKPPSVASSGS